MLVGVGLGVILLVLSARRREKVKWLAILQIALSILVPVSVALVLQGARMAGAAGGTDWEMFVYLLGHEYNAGTAFVITAFYAILLIVTTLTIERLVRFKSLAFESK